MASLSHLLCGMVEKTCTWELGCVGRQRGLTGRCHLPHNSQQEKVNVEGVLCNCEAKAVRTKLETLSVTHGEVQITTKGKREPSLGNKTWWCFSIGAG